MKSPPLLRLLALLLVCMSPASGAFASCAGQLVTENIFGPPACIPDQPRRIVTLDPLLTLGMLSELGVPIVAAPLSGIQDAEVRAAAKAAAVVDIGHPLQPSVERILSLKPDLIIGSAEVHGQIHAKLSRIAPTLLVKHIHWKAHLLLLAELTSRTETARTALRAYEARAAAIKARVPSIEVSVARVKPRGFNIYLDGPAAYAPYAVLREAGIKRTAYETTTGTDIIKRADWEELSALDGRILLYIVVSGYDPTPDNALAAETVANPFWQMLPAVRAGQAHRVDRATWMGFHGVASAHRVLDDVERLILTPP